MYGIKSVTVLIWCKIVTKLCLKVKHQLWDFFRPLPRTNPWTLVGHPAVTCGPYTGLNLPEFADIVGPDLKKEISKIYA